MSKYSRALSLRKTKARRGLLDDDPMTSAKLAKERREERRRVMGPVVDCDRCSYLQQTDDGLKCTYPMGCLYRL